MNALNNSNIMNAETVNDRPTMKVDKSNLMKAAHAIVKRQHLTLSAALKQAWKAAKLKLRLFAGYAKFAYRKLNGEVREAVGTLRHLDYVNRTDGTRQKPLDVMCYFDTEKGAFRSFQIANLI